MTLKVLSNDEPKNIIRIIFLIGLFLRNDLFSHLLNVLIPNASHAPSVLFLKSSNKFNRNGSIFFLETSFTGPQSSFMLQSKATAQLLLWTFPFTFSVYYHFCGSLTALQEKVRGRTSS